MNRRLCVWIVALGMGSGAPLVFAQAAPAPAAPAAAGPTTNPSAIPGIPTDIKGSSSISPASKTTIDGFIASLIQIVVNGQPPEQQKARDRLINEVPAPGSVSNGGFTAQYFDAYSASLDQQVLAALKANPPLRVRLNLGVVSARVAERTNSSQQVASAEALLNDPTEAVALWGMKTAKFILPSMLQVQVGKNTLMPLMVSTGLKFPGPVLDETYQGLTLNPMGITVPKNAAAARQQIVAVIPTVQGLLQQRNAMWGNGVPKDPEIDAQGASFLIIVAVWGDQTPAQQRETLQQMHDLLDNAQNAYGNAADKRDLFDLINRVVSGFSVVSSSLANPTLTEAVAVAKKVTPTMPPAQVQAACATLLRAVEALPQMQAPATPAAPITQGGPTSRATSGSSPPANLAVIK